MKTVSLEKAKALHEAGIIKESSFYWIPDEYDTEDNYILVWSNDFEGGVWYRERIPAPTTDELLEVLPDDISNIYTLSVCNGKYIARHEVIKSVLREKVSQFENDNPADALADLLLELNKQGLL